MIAVVVAVTGWGTSVAHAQAIMGYGAWEMRTKVIAGDSANGEATTVSESTTKSCLLKSFLERDPYLTPQVDEEKMRRKGATCTISEAMRDGNEASWRAICQLADGSRVDMTVKNSVARHRLSSVITQLVHQDGRTTRMQIITDGRRFGECFFDTPRSH